ncbi:2-dehydro-3-deoxygalactonokinase [Klebsiella michiganensis]|nr:2-dehydro-3-deoxygalactonokinase [Klebsiella michiganensis]
MLAFVIGLAMIFALTSNDIISYITKMISMLMSGLFVCSILGRFWLRFNWQGALTALLSGMLVSIVVLVKADWAGLLGQSVHTVGRRQLRFRHFCHRHDASQQNQPSAGAGNDYARAGRAGDPGEDGGAGLGRSTMKDYIAVDWGSTQLRGWLIRNGQCVGTKQLPLGITRLNGRSPADVFAEHVAPWRGAEMLPVLMAGMIGSDAGWQAVPYMACPAAIDAPGQQPMRRG